MKTLTFRQPWAWLIFHGKPVENRDWPWYYRGPLAIHAAATMMGAEWEAARLFVAGFDPELANKIPRPAELVTGAVIGIVDQVACVTAHPSPFFVGPYGHVYANPRELAAPMRAQGKQGPWNWTPPMDIEALLRPRAAP